MHYLQLVESDETDETKLKPLVIMQLIPSLVLLETWQINTRIHATYLILNVVLQILTQCRNRHKQYDCINSNKKPSGR